MANTYRFYQAQTQATLSAAIWLAQHKRAGLLTLRSCFRGKPVETPTAGPDRIENLVAAIYIYRQGVNGQSDSPRRAGAPKALKPE